jgi:dTDP-4-amino-4,6-dideoxygalactose transaminase
MSVATLASPSKTPVPFVDLRIQYQRLRGEILEALEEVAESTAFVLGPRVAEFEKAFAAFSGARHCVALNSGTSALHLALITAGVKPGDEVITVPMTFIATSWGISYVGATPVFVDVDPSTYTMDVNQVRKRISAKTKAILPVHLYGQPADMGPLLEIGKEYGIPVIEDAAQAHGSTYQGKHAGTLGQCGCFSFYPGKNLGAYGEGGAIVTNDDQVAKRLRSLRDHAQEERYHHSEIGFNYRMDAMQGAVLGIKLKHLQSWIEARRLLANRYKKYLADLPLQLPHEAKDRSHVWHLFVVLHPERDRIRRELEERGIGTGLHYPIPLHMQKAYAHLGYVEGAFPVSEKIGRECMSLPLFPEMTVRQQDAVIEALKDCLREDS